MTRILSPLIAEFRLAQHPTAKVKQAKIPVIFLNSREGNENQSMNNEGTPGRSLSTFQITVTIAL